MKFNKYSKKEKYSYALGVYPTIELIQNRPDRVARVVLSKKGGSNRGVQKIKEICKKKNILVEYNENTLYKFSPKGNVYAAGIFSKYISELDTSATHVVLDKPSDMGNVGTIIRTMTGFNVYNLALIGNSVDYFHPKVIRASMGSMFSINVSSFKDIDTYMNIFKKHTLYAFLTNGKKSVRNIKFKSPASLIFGNEGQGLGNEYSKLENTTYIPNTNDIDSLNLSVAVGIGLYELNNQ